IGSPGHLPRSPSATPIPRPSRGGSHGFFYSYVSLREPHSFPTRRSSDLVSFHQATSGSTQLLQQLLGLALLGLIPFREHLVEDRSEEHTSELQSRENLVCRLLLEKKQPKVVREHQLVIPEAICSHTVTTR